MQALCPFQKKKKTKEKKEKKIKKWSGTRLIGLFCKNPQQRSWNTLTTSNDGLIVITSK